MHLNKMNSSIRALVSSVPNVKYLAFGTPKNLSHEVFKMPNNLAWMNSNVPNLERYDHKC